MLICGLTGGIATGKSLISKVFRDADIPVVDADTIARQVVIPGSSGLKQIVSTFGGHYLNRDGSLNRSKLGNFVFQNITALNDLNTIMRPLIQKERDRQFKKLEDQHAWLIIYDAALIIEMNDADQFRPLIVVSCPRETQINRLMGRNGIDYQSANNIINQQLSLEEKLKFADLVIDTSKTIDDTINQTKNIIQHLFNKYLIKLDTKELL